MKILLNVLLFSLSVLFANAQSIKSILRPDGTFDIVGSTIKITNCYPAFDNNTLKPVSVKVTSEGNLKKIQYTLLDGNVELLFGYEGDALTIKMNVEGKKDVPSSISILHDAEVLGANKIYRSASQIMGNAGIKDWPKNKTDYSSCNAITGLKPDSGYTLVISTRNYKKYNSYTNVYPTDRHGGKKLIDVCILTEKVSATDIPGFYFTEHQSAYEAMKNEANAAAKFMAVKLDKKQAYHWCSWYYAYYHLTDKMLSEYVQGFKKMNPPVNIQTIQIDAGYHPHAGDWLEPSTKFPKGLQSSVNEILASNYRAGIWIGPYMVGNRSKVFLDHPDWVLKQNDGKPVIQMSFYGEQRLWGAMDEEIYILDTSNPEVMEHLRMVFRAFKQMGITYFKTDFMLNGAMASNEVKRFAPGKTSIEYQRELFDMIRKEIGPESFWLGCIAPFAPMLGYVDGMRISADIHPDWGGATNMFEETKGNQHINNVWWQNDPDAMIIRSKYSDLSDEETKSIALWMGLLGGVINTSDLFYEIPKHRADLFRFLEPGDQNITASFPFTDNDSRAEALVKTYPSQKSWAVLFVNRKNEAATSTYSLKELTGTSEGMCYNWSISASEKSGTKKDLVIQLAPHQSKLIFISTEGKSPEGITLNGKKR